MHVRIPLLFTRWQGCTQDNNLKPNTENRYTDRRLPIRESYVVMLPLYMSGKEYNSNWMDNPHLATDAANGDLILVDDVDIVDYEKDIHVFDLDDRDEAYKQALRKMKELWTEMELES